MRFDNPTDSYMVIASLSDPDVADLCGIDRNAVTSTQKTDAARAFMRYHGTTTHGRLYRLAVRILQAERDLAIEGSD